MSGQSPVRRTISARRARPAALHIERAHPAVRRESRESLVIQLGGQRIVGCIETGDDDDFLQSLRPPGAAGHEHDHGQAAEVFDHLAGKAAARHPCLDKGDSPAHDLAAQHRGSMTFSSFVASDSAWSGPVFSHAARISSSCDIGRRRPRSSGRRGATLRCRAPRAPHRSALARHSSTPQAAPAAAGTRAAADSGGSNSRPWRNTDLRWISMPSSPRRRSIQPLVERISRQLGDLDRVPGAYCKHFPGRIARDTEANLALPASSLAASQAAAPCGSRRSTPR